MPDFGIFRGFNDKLFGDKLYAGQLPTQLGLIGSENAVTFFYLLNDYPNAAAAYSLRLLRSAYTGDAIEVRIDTTGQPTYDIGFINNELDVTTLEGYCTGGLDAYVTTWYDQSGNGNDATQTTAANQPQIVSSGSVILENGKAAVQFDGTNDNLPNGVGTALPSDVSAFVVRSFSSYPSTYRTMFNYKTWGLTHNSAGGGSYGIAHIFSQSTTSKSNDYPTTTGQGLDFLYNKSNLERNNYISTLSAGGGYGPGISALGSWSGTAQCFSGKIQELVIYEIDQNSNKSGIKTNINDFYSIY